MRATTGNILQMSVSVSELFTVEAQDVYSKSQAVVCADQGQR